MNRSLMIEGVDLDALTDAVAAAVVAKMKPLIEQSTAPLLVDGDEMARLAGVSRPTIDRLRAAKLIPSVLLGTRRMYQPSAVIEALVANEKGAAK